MYNEQISSKVLEVYKKCKIVTLPVDCFELLSQYGYKIFTYEDLKTSNNELYKLCVSYSNEAFIHRTLRIAAYNNKKNFYRIRFSLMHELGHIVMDTDNEDVADCFASHIIAPRILIHKNQCFTADDIHDKFGLSYAASNRALASYKEWFREISHNVPRKPLEPELQLEQIFFPSKVIAQHIQDKVKTIEPAVHTPAILNIEGWNNWGIPSHQQWFG